MLTHSGFEQSRYAVELVLAANESAESSVIPSSFKSLDDEHTPGVFTVRKFSFMIVAGLKQLQIQIILSNNYHYH